MTEETPPCHYFAPRTHRDRTHREPQSKAAAIEDHGSVQRRRQLRQKRCTRRTIHRTKCRRTRAGCPSSLTASETWPQASPICPNFVRPSIPLPPPVVPAFFGSSACLGTPALVLRSRPTWGTGRGEHWSISLRRPCQCSEVLSSAVGVRKREYPCPPTILGPLRVVPRTCGLPLNVHADPVSSTLLAVWPFPFSPLIDFVVASDNNYTLFPNRSCAFATISLVQGHAQRSSYLNRRLLHSHIVRTLVPASPPS